MNRRYNAAHGLLVCDPRAKDRSRVFKGLGGRGGGKVIDSARAPAKSAGAGAGAGAGDTMMEKTSLLSRGTDSHVWEKTNHRNSKRHCAVMGPYACSHVAMEA